MLLLIRIPQGENWGYTFNEEVFALNLSLPDLIRHLGEKYDRPLLVERPTAIAESLIREQKDDKPYRIETSFEKLEAFRSQVSPVDPDA